MIPSEQCDSQVTKRALETNDFNTIYKSPSSSLGRHLSKSASELSSPREPPEIRPFSAANTGSVHFSVVQKTHSFFHQLRSRWARSKSRERLRRKSPGRQLDREYSTDYAADLSSDHSSPSTQSPRHQKLQKQTSHQPFTDSHLSLTKTSSAIEAHSTCGPSLKTNKISTPTPGAITGLDLLPGDRNLCGCCWSSTSRSNSFNGRPAVVELEDVQQQHLDELQTNDETTRRREATLRQHSFFQLRVHLKRGHGLVAMDKNGTSDPYVKFKTGGRLAYKSRTVYRDLNPIWDESFTIPIEDPFVPIHIKVFDYDWGLQDDFMGSTFLDLTALELGHSTDITLGLQDPARPNGQLGEISLTVTLLPRTQEDKEQYFQKNTKMSDVNKRLKSQIWSSVVTIILVEGRNLLAMDPDTATSDPYCKFRLGNEKYKSRVVWRSLNPRWLEQFDLHLYDDGDQQLEITVWDKDRTRDDFIGRCVIDLSALERERTLGFWKDLEDGAGSLYLLLTISGTTASETISDLTTYEENPRERQILEARYAWHRTFHNMKDVGHLTVKVFRATGLAAADLGGKSDPFCVLELGNARLQTQTEYKTLTPNWQKIFTFNVKDINTALEVTVYDEDRDHKVEFLGKVMIPLLRIRNGERRWYALKDKKLRSRAKGVNPQILLEMTALWNPIRACIRTLNPREEKYMQTEVKFKRQVFVRNVLRLKILGMHLMEFYKTVQGCFEWESTIRSFIALILWLIVCYYFELWMLPALVLLIFMKQLIVKSISTPSPLPGDETGDSEFEDDDEDDKDKEEKKSLKERLQAVQEVTQTVQNIIGHIASLGEAVKNIFNFTVPYLTWIAISLLFCGVFLIYFIPLRYLLMLWGANKFARRILRPHSVPNNEVLDLLSRVPDDELLDFLQLLGTGLSTKPGALAIFKWLQLDYRDLKIILGPEPERRREPRKKHKVS